MDCAISIEHLFSEYRFVCEAVYVNEWTIVDWLGLIKLINVLLGTDFSANFKPTPGHAVSFDRRHAMNAY